MTDHLDRLTCEWLRDIGLPQEINEIGMVWEIDTNHPVPVMQELGVIGKFRVLIPTFNDLEDFAIMRLRGIFPEAEPEDLYVEIIVFGDGGAGGTAGSMTEEESLGDFDGDTKPEMLVSLIRKLVEMEGDGRRKVMKCPNCGAYIGPPYLKCDECGEEGNG